MACQTVKMGTRMQGRGQEELVRMKKIAIAAALLLGGAVGSGPAWADIFVGPGFGTPCAQGSCPVFGTSVNPVGAHSLDLFQASTGGGDDTGALLLIFAVPNNPTNALGSNPVTGAQLHVPAANATSSAVSVGSLSFEGEMTHGEVYGFLGLLDGNIVAFNDLAAADYALFPTTYDATTNPIDNFSIYEVPLTTTGGAVFGDGDLINVDFTSLPVGTFSLGYATPSLNVTDTPFDQAGVSGLATPVAEPAGYMLLGAALLCLGLVRRRGG